MLKPESAREQLGKLKSKQHRLARLARVQKLPKAQAELGLGLFGLLPTGRPPKDWSERRKLEQAATAKLAADHKARAKVFAALFPTMHADVEAGWQLKGRIPYTSGYARRAFRAPSRPEFHTANRHRYIELLFDELAEIPDDVLSVEWLAAWGVHLGYSMHEFGYLLAAAIEAGGAEAETVLSIVKDCAANRHEIGGPGGHTTRALLCCAQKEAWEFAENLLLAAQRQEGLRQSILEAVDESHPEAFQRMLGLLLDNNLIRFASVARAAGVWFGEVEAVENPKKLKADLEAGRDLLADAALRKKAIEKGDATTAYRGLWALAFLDVEEAVKAATPLLRDKNPARRLAAAKLIQESGLPEGVSLMLPLIDDPEPCLVSVALAYFRNVSALSAQEEQEEYPDRYPNGFFERIEKIIPTLPAKSKELKPLVPSWPIPDLGQAEAAALLFPSLGKRPAERLLPYMSLMSDHDRMQSLAKLCEARTLSTKVRQTLLTIAGEPNRYVRELAMKYLKLSKLAEDEVQTLEGYLTRKTADFRRSVFELLLNRPDKLAIASIDRPIAHPLDFVKAGNWPEWQAECFRAERVQPFKQLFREVYVLTRAEMEDVDRSRRYSG